MCLGCRTRPACQVGGIGDAVSAAPPLPRFHLLLANPGVARPTPAVYAARKGAFSEAQPVIDPGSTAALFAERLAERSNDLARAAESLSPAIGDVRRAIADTSGCLLARMSGSGATCFGIFATATEAEAAAGRLRTAHPDWWIRTTAVLQGPPVAGTTEAG